MFDITLWGSFFYIKLMKKHGRAPLKVGRAVRSIFLLFC